MTRKRAYGLLLFCLLAADAAYAIPEAQKLKAGSQVPREISGLDWLQLSLAGRLEYILISMSVISNHGVHLEKSPNDYCNAVQERLRAHQDLYQDSITNILAQAVYEKEHGAREALDKVKVKL